jgi:glycine cleavage system H protein
MTWRQTFQPPARVPAAAKEKTSFDNPPVLRKSPPTKFMSSKVPSDLKYAKSHEWVRLNGDVATIGISDHAQHELTDVVFVELPQVGRKVKAGEACAVVESVKTASDIYSPVSGEVLAANQKIVDKPDLVNDQPYGDGWFFQVKLSAASEVAALLSPADYSAQIGG